MKILTLNTHSFMEDCAKEKFSTLLKTIKEERFDLIALQEVNQSMSSEILEDEDLDRLGFVKPSLVSVPIKENNYVLQLIKALRKYGIKYNWSWVANHIGYDKFDEGVALLSLSDIDAYLDLFISKNKSYDNYKTRKILGIKTMGKWFFSVHMGWWNEIEDPFSEQWEKIEHISSNLLKNQEIYLLGDFNSPAHKTNEGYEFIKKRGIFFDTFDLAGNKDIGITVDKSIDGWKDKDQANAMRIDYIFKNNSNPVKSSKVIFNGENKAVVSDHFAVCVELY